MRGNLRDLASVAGMPSRRVIRDMIRHHRDFPLVSQGFRGIDFQFDLEEAAAFVRRVRAQRAIDAADRARLIEAIGLTIPTTGDVDDA